MAHGFKKQPHRADALKAAAAICESLPKLCGGVELKKAVAVAPLVKALEKGYAEEAIPKVATQEVRLAALLGAKRRPPPAPKPAAAKKRKADESEAESDDELEDVDADDHERPKRGKGKEEKRSREGQAKKGGLLLPKQKGLDGEGKKKKGKLSQKEAKAAKKAKKMTIDVEA